MYCKHINIQNKNILPGIAMNFEGSNFREKVIFKSCTLNFRELTFKKVLRPPENWLTSPLAEAKCVRTGETHEYARLSQKCKIGTKKGITSEPHTIEAMIRVINVVKEIW